MRKRLLAVLLAGTMVTALLTGCGGGESNSSQQDVKSGEKSGEATAGEDNEEESKDGDFVYKVGYSNLADSDENCYLAAETFKNIVESDEFKEAVGHEVSVEWADSDGDITKQTTNVETLISKGIDVLFMPGVDTAGNASAVEACNRAGIPVFMIASESEGGDYKFVGFNEKDCGKVQGDYVAENAEKGDKICYMTGTPGREAQVLREEGFLEGLESRDDLELLSTQSGDFKAEDAMQVTEDWVQAYGADIDWIVTQDNQMGQGVVEVLKAANMLDKVRISSWVVSGTWDAEYLKNGEIEQAIYVSFKTLGETAADVCQRFYKGEEIEEKTYMELQSLTEDNYADYLK